MFPTSEVLNRLMFTKIYRSQSQSSRQYITSCCCGIVTSRGRGSEQTHVHGDISILKTKPETICSLRRQSPRPYIILYIQLRLGWIGFYAAIGIGRLVLYRLLFSSENDDLWKDCIGDDIDVLRIV